MQLLLFVLTITENMYRMRIHIYCSVKNIVHRKNDIILILYIGIMEDLRCSLDVYTKAIATKMQVQQNWVCLWLSWWQQGCINMGLERGTDRQPQDERNSATKQRTEKGSHSLSILNMYDFSCIMILDYYIGRLFLLHLLDFFSKHRHKSYQ